MKIDATKTIEKIIRFLIDTFSEYGINTEQDAMDLFMDMNIDDVYTWNEFTIAAIDVLKSRLITRTLELS